ncbi:hypothetical protein P171DRAFT_437516 [Karstenula rhodostoma CBS 690.94]|uniref:Uncharacterized protein n=1 Tax=Karstenula rhodostoma CBS 690.94 TaxID=1392251 RepID=A0A9P4U6D9_9PLEO|nr:hypothetical protein P171DRAFT_437516 [Karstenula rhodostoma CBS 690.94]
MNKNMNRYSTPPIAAHAPTDPPSDLPSVIALATHPALPLATNDSHHKAGPLVWSGLPAEIAQVKALKRMRFRSGAAGLGAMRCGAVAGYAATRSWRGS